MSMKINAYLGGEDEDNETYDGDHSFYMEAGQFKEDDAERENVSLCTWKAINADEQSKLEAKLEIEETCCDCFCDVSKFDAYKNWKKFQDGIYWPRT